MDLSSDVRELLRLVARVRGPVAVFDLFPVINPRSPGMDDLDGDYEAWIEGQLDLSEAHMLLRDRGLIGAVRRAGAKRHDLVEATPLGRAVAAGLDPVGDLGSPRAPECSAKLR